MIQLRGPAGNYLRVFDSLPDAVNKTPNNILTAWFSGAFHRALSVALYRAEDSHHGIEPCQL
jgi:hypothetical protein